MSTVPLPLEAHWSEIRRVVDRSQRSGMHCAIASVGPDGGPHVTPIGMVFLHDAPGGFFFDRYTTGLAANVEARPDICLMAVDTRRGFWLRSLLRGRFATPPGLRLIGTAGPLRPASPHELDAVRARVRPVRWMRGAKLLWSDFSHVRDLHFTALRPVEYPVMCDRHWGR
ncbi:pyridoxamine 5'-phosphate oxidase family protein [Rhizobacter sp. LjRoot28]|uniref:pyridoxamine 5'-phosphate oxidase family protein n=1 Tax=Rhizobacter sp. LjRoot28 TaxID=3342309 RepID=UPI003ECDC6B8